MSSWGAATDAVNLLVGGFPEAALTKTSTATMCLTGGTALRMWDIDSGTLKRDFSETSAGDLLWPDSVLDLGVIALNDYYGSVNQYVCYIDSDASFDFAVEGTSVATPSVTTIIPSVRNSALMVYEVIEDFVSFGGYRYARNWRQETAAAFDVWYSDPCVVKVPDTVSATPVYLMILVRQRVLSSTVDDAAAAGESYALGPGRSLNDIICYWSYNEAFTGVHGTDVFGPVLLVHSMSALVDPALDAMVAFRCWLGVPGAVFVGDQLYLYYIAQKHQDGPATPSVGYLDEVDEAQIDACVQAFNDGEGFTETVVLKRFTESFVLDYILDSTRHVPEDEWTPYDAVPGYCCLPIRTWMAVAGAPYQVVDFAEQVASTVADVWVADGRGSFYGTVGVQIVDPMPVECDDALHLFVAVRPNSTILLSEAENTLFGIWRFRALPDTLTVTDERGDSHAIEFGRDFVVAPTEASAARDYEDQVCEFLRGPPVLDYKDPDPVYIESLSTWRVYTHNEQALVYFDKVESAFCLDAEDAWALVFVAAGPTPPSALASRSGRFAERFAARKERRRRVEEALVSED